MARAVYSWCIYSLHMWSYIMHICFSLGKETIEYTSKEISLELVNSDV